MSYCRALLLRSALLLAAFAAAPAASLPPLCVTASDASVSLCVDAVSGALVSLQSGATGSLLPLSSGGAALGGGATELGAPTVAATAGGGIEVTRSWAYGGGSGHAPSSGARTVETFSPGATSIVWAVAIAPGAAGGGAWSAPLLQSLALAGGAEAKLWAAWDRDAAADWPAVWTDPLQPSDLLPSGWWSGAYRYGNARGYAGADILSLPIVSLLSPSPTSSSAADWGFSLILSPVAAAPLELWLRTNGSANSLEWERAHHRIADGRVVALSADIIAHAGDLRGGLAWLAATYAEYLAPVNPDVFASFAGLGSYSSWLGRAPTLASIKPVLEGMGYAGNWDLSGTYFPYMGMFLPPLTDPAETWENDPEGTQPRINASFNLISSWYREMVDNGFTPLSYGNVNEFGLNVLVPPPAEIAAARAARRLGGARAGGAPFCAATWRNASACLAGELLDSLVVRAYEEASGKTLSGPLYSWQNAVVVDPVANSSYRAFMLEQLARHITYEDAFSGSVVDRSDWADLYNLDEDDGVSFIEQRAASGAPGACGAMRVSYLETIAELRGALSARPMPTTPSGKGILLLNSAGNSRLDTLRHYDGSFSEGSAVNGVGLLGLRSPAVLWTYSSAECCSSPARTASFFQSQMLLGVLPMAPLPGNDHSIAWGDATAAAAYARYGRLLSALGTKVWALHPHIAAAVNASGVAPAKVNSFVALVDGAAAEQCLLLVVAFAETPAGLGARLNLTDVSRAWLAPHPLRAHRRVPHAPARAGAAYTAEALLPGAAGWLPLPGSSTPSFMLDVPLADGAALVRVRVAQ